VATERFKCTVDDLLRLGATGQLSIYFFPAGLQLVSEKYADDEIIERCIVDAYEPLKLSRRSIELLEAGNSDALVGLDFDSNTTHKVRRFSPTIKRDPYDFAEMFADPAAWNKKTETDYHDVKISDVKLVVKHSELMSLVERAAESEANAEQSWRTPANTIAATVEAGPTNTSADEALATLFDPVSVAVLAKMFSTDKQCTTEQWEKWAERAARNGLKDARDGRKTFNPYKAGMWFLTKGTSGWDIARCKRVLANNLPDRSRDEAHQLTGKID